MMLCPPFAMCNKPRGDHLMSAIWHVISNDRQKELCCIGLLFC